MNTSADTAYANPTRLPGVPSKPLGNPRRSKPVPAADAALASELAPVLAAVPAQLAPARGTCFPLLTQLAQGDGAELATRLVFVAARIHQWADERRTAEYLLRHRYEVESGARSVDALLSAARCAAEMDVRRVRMREIPCSDESLTRHEVQIRNDRINAPSVPDLVVNYLRDVLGARPASVLTWSRLHDAATVAIELAHRIAARRGGASIYSMRSDARPSARLSCHLQSEFGDPTAARSLARLLVGGDGTQIESALLWWAAHQDADPAGIPERVRIRWARDLMDADPALRTRRARKRTKSDGPASAHLFTFVT